MSKFNDEFYKKVWEETNRRVNLRKRRDDLVWNKIWAEVSDELSRKEKRNFN
jgi:hypothetical protein